MLMTGPAHGDSDRCGERSGTAIDPDDIPCIHQKIKPFLLCCTILVYNRYVDLVIFESSPCSHVYVRSPGEQATLEER
jgi:hypothetical protein